VDLGCGDGRYVLARAAAEPRALVIGVDADPAAMAEASRRAARPSRKGGLPNALFARASTEALPCDLDGLVDEARMHLPWGSLLRGLVGPEQCVLGGLARVARTDAELTALVSFMPRDVGAGLPTLDGSWRSRAEAAYAACGWRIVEWRPANPADVAAARSTWAKRLGPRPIWLIRARRLPAGAASVGRAVDPRRSGVADSVRTE
jgi:16S rRNA (adenine(1408)-N(1))-methyltransferase